MHTSRCSWKQIQVNFFIVWAYFLFVLKATMVLCNWSMKEVLILNCRFITKKSEWKKPLKTGSLADVPYSIKKLINDVESFWAYLMDRLWNMTDAEFFLMANNWKMELGLKLKWLKHSSLKRSNLM